MLALTINQYAADPMVTLIVLVLYGLYQLFAFLNKKKEEADQAKADTPRPLTQTEAPRPVAADPFEELFEALGKPKTDPLPPPVSAPPPLPRLPAKTLPPGPIDRTEEGPTFAETRRPTSQPTLAEYQMPTFQTRLDKEKMVTAVEIDAYVTLATAEVAAPDLALIKQPETVQNLFLQEIRESVRQPRNLRRAILINEILGSPKALSL